MFTMRRVSSRRRKPSSSGAGDNRGRRTDQFRSTRTAWRAWTGVLWALLLCPPSFAVSLQTLQGQWIGTGPPGTIRISIQDKTLRFEASRDFWYEATFTLPVGTSHQQLQATIQDSAPPKKDIGVVVYALVEIVDGTLRLAVDDGSNEAPIDFDFATSVYTLERAAKPKEP